MEQEIKKAVESNLDALARSAVENLPFYYGLGGVRYDYPWHYHLFKGFKGYRWCIGGRWARVEFFPHQPNSYKVWRRLKREWNDEMVVESETYM